MGLLLTVRILKAASDWRSNSISNYYDFSFTQEELDKFEKFSSELLAASKAAEAPTVFYSIDSILKQLSDTEISMVLHYCERLLKSREAEAA